MIVLTMSKEEIIKELNSDFDIVKRKSEFVIKDLRRTLLKTKTFPIVKANEYVTPKTKNKWIYIHEITSKDDIFQTFVNYHYTSMGLMAALITTDKNITFFTGHFFSRFVEREKLSIELPVDKIKAFFIANPAFHFEVLKQLESGASEILGKVKTGVILGIRTKNNIYVCNTYLSDALLRKDQSTVADYLKVELENVEAMQKAGLI